MPIEIVRVPAFADNYLWLGHGGDETFIVDPGDAAPVLRAAEQRGWAITHILNTHWHGDHTGGNLAVKAASGATVIGPAREADRIPGIDRLVSEGDVFELCGTRVRVLDVPGHTAGHIAFVLDREEMAFVGDTLFALGCGRLFEGTADEMWMSLGKLMALPSDTAIYCAHEYTEANARFALTIEPGNLALRSRAEAIVRARAEGEPTVPTSIALETATNPFLRAGDAAEFARRRLTKDGFRG